jgi:hypothetical protein
VSAYTCRLNLSVYPQTDMEYQQWKKDQLQDISVSSRTGSKKSLQFSLQRNESLRTLATGVIEKIATGGSFKNPKLNLASSRKSKQRSFFRKREEPMVTPNYCGPSLSARGIKDQAAVDEWRQNILSSKISLIVVNLQSPFSLLNSLQSWNQSGLLDMLDETIVILNQASIVELSMCESFGVKVVQPKFMDIPVEHKRKRDLLTIGSSFYHGLRIARNDHVLFLESDFEIDLNLPVESIYAQLLGAVGMLDRGMGLVRLSSRKNMGTHSFHECSRQEFVISTDPTDVLLRKRNWFRFYCPTWNKKQGGHKLDNYVTDCLSDPLVHYKCFTSRDSSWSLNACMVKKSGVMNDTFSFHLPISEKDQKAHLSLQELRKAYPVYSMTIPEIGVNFCSQKQVHLIFLIVIEMPSLRAMMMSSCSAL